MDHKLFLASLNKAQRQGLTKLSNYKGLQHFIIHLGAISISTMSIILSAPFWQLFLMAQGILLVFLFTLLHETCHRTPFRSLWLNTLIGHICGFVLLLPAEWFRYFHLAHHRFTQNPDKDPELAQEKPKSLAGYVWHISGFPVWFSHLKTLIRNATGGNDDDFVPKRGGKKVAHEARFYVLGYFILLGLSVWQQSTILLFIWFFPLVIGQPFLRLYLLAEHGRCAFVSDKFENTRTIYTNPIIRALAWNMPYHTEHHCFPTVPFHNLPKLHRLVKSHLKVTSNGYASFNKSYARSLKD